MWANSASLSRLAFLGRRFGRRLVSTPQCLSRPAPTVELFLRDGTRARNEDPSGCLGRRDPPALPGVRHALKSRVRPSGARRRVHRSPPRAAKETPPLKHDRCGRALSPTLSSVAATATLLCCETSQCLARQLVRLLRRVERVELYLRVGPLLTPRRCLPAPTWTPKPLRNRPVNDRSSRLLIRFATSLRDQVLAPGASISRGVVYTSSTTVRRNPVDIDRPLRTPRAHDAGCGRGHRTRAAAAPRAAHTTACAYLKRRLVPLPLRVRISAKEHVVLHRSVLLDRWRNVLVASGPQESLKLVDAPDPLPHAHRWARKKGAEG